MGKVYSVPKEIGEAPGCDLSSGVKEFHKKEQEYMQKLKEWVIANGDKNEFVGEIVRFPVADGYAQYMVFSLRPVKLIHIPLGDAWHFQYVERLTATDIKKEVTRQKRLAALFA